MKNKDDFKSLEIKRLELENNASRDENKILKKQLKDIYLGIDDRDEKIKALEAEMQGLRSETQKGKSYPSEAFKTGIFTGITLVFALVGFISTLVYLFK